MSEFFSNMVEKTKKFANTAVDETKDAAQKAKLNTKINSDQKAIDKNMAEIGRYFYEQSRDNPPQELEQCYANIKTLQDSIAMSRSELEKI